MVCELYLSKAGVKVCVYLLLGSWILWDIFFLWTKNHMLYSGSTRKSGALFKKNRNSLGYPLRIVLGKVSKCRRCSPKGVRAGEGAEKCAKVRISTISRGHRGSKGWILGCLYTLSCSNSAFRMLSRIEDWLNGLQCIYTCRVLCRHEKYKSQCSDIELSTRYFLKRWEQCPHSWVFLNTEVCPRS